MEKSENSNSTEILNQEFFDTIKNSKKINTKSQKIKELSKYFENIGVGPQPPEIKNRIPDLFSLLLINLNENNNNYVLAQMELIQILGKTLNNDDNYKTFIKQCLPKLFDKFYLGNNKINEILVKMFSEFIAYKILTIKDYYQYIENIPLEEEDNYRINILEFLYESINKDESVLLNNIPKSLNELIKKLVNDNESDISETASKILNILINRDIQSNKKKENNENIENNNNEQINHDEKNKEDKGGTKPIDNFVNNIVSAIKQNVENNKDNNNDNNKDNNIDGNNENKDNNINQDLNNDDNFEHKQQKEENIKKDENKNINDIKEEKTGENKIHNDENVDKDDAKIIEEKKEEKVIEDKKEETVVDEKKEEKVNEEHSYEDKVKEIKTEEKQEEKKIEGIKETEETESSKIIKNEEIKNNEKTEDIKDKEIINDKNEERIIENKNEEKLNEAKEGKIDNTPIEQNIEANAEIKKEENNKDKKEETPKIENNEKTEENKIIENKEEKNIQKNKEDLEIKNEEIKIEKTENKEINNEEKKEEKIEEKKENENNKENISEEKVKEETDNKEIKEEKKNETTINNNTTEAKKEDNKIPEIDNKNKNDNIEKKDESPINNDIEKKENTNIQEATEKSNNQENEIGEYNKDESKKEETKYTETSKEETKTEEIKPQEIQKEEPKIENTNKEKLEENKQPIEKKEEEQKTKIELPEEKPKEETITENIKPEIKEENKETQIKPPESKNENTEKKEEVKQKDDKNNPEIKKENTEEKKPDDKKKNDGKKKTGIKSKISKFRKNFVKNKNKDGGFEFELVVEKKKDNPPKENQTSTKEKENIKEEINKDKENVEEKKAEEKPKEEDKIEVIEKAQEEIKKNEDKPKEEIKEEKVEAINKEINPEKPKEEINEEIKKNKKELTPIKEENNEIKEEVSSEKSKEKEVITEKIKEEDVIKEKTKEETNKKKAQEEEVINEKPKEETKKEIVNEKPKEEIKPEIKPKEPESNSIKEEKIKEEVKQQAKIPESNNKEPPKETPPPQEQPEENPENKKSLGINQESLNEFEKKLQMALEQEEKDKNNNENLVDPTPAPIKQKKEDPKFDEIKSKLGKEIVDSLFSPKWETKKHGFELINEFINNNSKDSYNFGDLIEYMKLKLKNYKETNFNINREAINVYINMIKKKLISKDTLINIIIAYHEKLSDIKLKDNLIELIKSSFDIIEPTNILKPIISKISKKNNAKLLIEYATFIGNLIEEYDVNDFPNKDIIDFCTILANNSNPQVRTSAISLLCILYKYLGKDVKTLTRDIKESTLKLIDAELDKVKVIDPKETMNKKKKVASLVENSDNKSGNNSKNVNKDLIPPQDISKKITPDIIKLLNSGKWAERKQGCETIEKILTSANMRILPNGLNTLMTTIKKKLSDSNKNFVKMLIALLSKLIESMKSGFKQWAKPIALALIPNLADKNQLMRNECQNCFDKWVEFTGFDSLVIHFPKFLSNDNVETRIEIMNFFMKHKDRFKNSKSLAESVYKDMMNPLLICLQDRSSNVRNLSEEIIKISLVYNPMNNYYKKSEDFKPAITKTLKQILDKIKQESSSNNELKQEANSTQVTESDITTQSINLNTEPNCSINKTNEKDSKKSSNIKSSNKKLQIQSNETSLKTESSIQDDISDKNEILSNEDNSSTTNSISNFNNKSSKKSEKDVNNKTRPKTTINSKRVKPKRKLSEDDLVNPLGTAMNKQMPATSVEHLASNSTILRKKEIKSFQKNNSQIGKVNNNTAVFLMNVKVIPNKAKRYDKDKKTKFNLETANKDYFIKLKEQCKSLFTEIFSKKIFSDDFRKQVEAFKDMKGQIDKKINIPIYFDNLDLILKIIGIKILNNLNPTLMKNLFEFLDSLFVVLSENKYKLNETESNIIISILIDKLSLNNNTLREHLLSLLNKYIEYLDTNKIMVTVINVALNKNNKIKTDILDLTIDLVSKEKLNVSTKVYAKLFCRFLPFYENVIRNKTLSLFQEIYSNIGEELWSMIEISEKDKEFLEENLCADDEGEDEEKEGEEEEDDENENEDENNEIYYEKEKDKNEIISNDKNQTSNITTDENKKTNKDSEKMKMFGSKNGPMTKEDLDIILDNLLIDDPNEKLNTIIIIHENICGKFDQNKEVLIQNIDKIITTFKSVSHKLFYMKDLNSIPIKFAKYLSIVFCKLASNKELISHLSYNILLDISRELLRYLLINGLDRIGDKQEGNIIFKSINSTMLRILENCDITFVISALLELIKEFHERDDKNLVNLSIKCLLKTTYNLSQNIDNINISKILLQIHLLLLSLQKKNKDLNKKSQTDALIISTVKNIVGEFVKYKKEKILEEYSKSVKNHKFNDKFLLKWIKAELEKP